MPDAGEQHFLGLDLLKVSEQNGTEHCAILLEIWKSGGLLQTSEAIAVDSTIEIALPDGCALAKVEDCVADPYGFNVEITVTDPARWFAGAYAPPYILPLETLTEFKPDIQSKRR
jgi:hypothetical protein